jgi:hypothetical protein
VQSMSLSFSRLRASVDSNDHFMHGHDERGGARASHAARFKRGSDNWALNDEQVRLLLLRSFPNMNTERETTEQRRRMLTWVTVIQWYFREGKTAGHIAMRLNERRTRIWKLKHPKRAELRFKKQTKRVEDTIRRIRKAAAGLRTDGKTRSSARGRPRK